MWLLLSATLPKTASADLFYKVEKAVAASDLSANANQNVPMVVTGLNVSGRMVGFYALKVHPPNQVAQQYLHAFVWDNAAGMFRDFNGDLPGVNASSSMALCVNTGGTVAGVCWNLYNALITQVGFVWQNGATATFLSPEGHDIDSVTAINASGHVVGTYYPAGGANLHGFFWDGLTCVDLGDLGDSALPLIWPQSLNDFDQVVGTSYDTGVSPPAPTAFVWQDGVIGYLDGADDYINTRALGINNAGAIIGSYQNPTPQTNRFVSGGFYLVDGTATGLGDLGGGRTVPFSLTAAGQVFGTSYGTDGKLHLFGWSTGSILDLGAAELSATDLSYQMTGVNASGAIAGFVHDASNHIQTALGTGGVQRRLNALLPAYLAFTQMSSAYGSQVLINDAGMIACAGTSASGQQMALLLSVDPDTDNDGLPDSWEMQHYGQLGVGKNDPASGGGGLTNWQAYQQGVDPKDFYNGKAPRLTIVSGDNQTAAPGSFVPEPLIVQLSNNLGTPAGKAVAVKFAVASGGGQLQATREASPKPAVSVLTGTDGQAKVFFQTPDNAGTPSSISTINATLAAANLSLPPVFTETADHSGPVNPTPTEPYDPTDPNDPNNPNNPQTVPVQSYACIDISGDDTPSDVTLVALNDAGQATFGYGTGTPALSFLDYEKFHWRTWENGQLGRDQTVDCCVPSGGGTVDQPEYDVVTISCLTGAGQAYGTMYTRASNSPAFYQLDGYLYQGGQGIVGPPSPPYLNGGEWGAGFESTSQGGVVAGANYNTVLNADDTGGDICLPGFVYKDGQYTFFDGESDYSEAEIPSNMTLVPNTIEPYAVNDKGWVAGIDGHAVPYVPKYWDGQTMRTLNSDVSTEYANGLNNQGTIIFRARVPGTKEGSLWENGARTILVNHLPAALAGKIADIQPISISNQTAEGTDATIYILAKAKIDRADATIVCTRDNDGDWCFARVGVPDGTTISQYATINSHGIIAAIGKPTSTENSGQKTGGTRQELFGNDAGLLLPPIQVTSVSFDGDKYWKLKSDDGKTTYEQPQWADANQKAGITGWDGKAFDPKEHNNAVAYTRNSTPKIGATFKIPGASMFNSVMFKADGPDDISIPATVGVVEADGETVTMPPTASAGHLPNFIEFYNRTDSTAFYLEWQVSIDGGTIWTAVNSTEHTVYVTLSDPQTRSNQETIFYLACRNQATQTDPAAIANTIYNQFLSSTLTVCRVGTTTGMQYWGAWSSNGTAEPFCYTTAGLLEHGDGRCGAWSQLLYDVFSAQGFTGVDIENIELLVTGYQEEYLYVKNWDLSNLQAPVPLTGIAGQGNSNPLHRFRSPGAHAMVGFMGVLYDPSYGTKYSLSSMDANRQAWEDTAVAAILVGDAVNGYFIQPHTAGYQQTRMTPQPH